VASVSGAAGELEARLAHFVRNQRLPGAAAGIVRGDSLEWSAAVGRSDVAASRPARTDSLYRIASITKTVTGTAVMQLADAGSVHLDDPAVTYLPELRLASSPFGPIEGLTIRRMLSHTSGLLSEPPDADWTAPHYEGVAQRNLDRAADIGIKVPPEMQHKYSNLGYQLLGEIIARVSGVPYPRYVREAILDPLGMTSTCFEPVPERLRDRRATGYVPTAYSDAVDVAPAMPPIWAEGGLWSSVGDLARWLAFQLGAYSHPPRESPVLPSARLRDMHRPRYLASDDWTQAWGVSWYAIRQDDVSWIQHAGDLHGFASCACFETAEQVGAVVLLNGMGDAPRLAMNLAAAACRAVRAGTPPAREPAAPVPARFRELLGSYADRTLGALFRVEWQDGKLQFTDPSEPGWLPVLAPTDDPDRFIVQPGFRQSGEEVVFRRGPDGRVTSVFAAARSLDRLDFVDRGETAAAG
jgi:CubicO group peptidase (beta-lactamase class C family)